MSACNFGFTFSLMFCMCSVNDMDVLYVIPRILGVWVRGMRVMLMVRCGMVLCSALQLVSRVTVDFVGAKFVIVWSLIVVGSDV